MEPTTKKGASAPTAPAPKARSSTSVRDVASRSKLLVVLFPGYAKVYADHPASMHVVTVPQCDSVEEERAALEQAEAGIPLLYRHLTDETLLVGTFNTNVPSLSKVAESEGLLLGLRAVDEAARRSVASKKAARRPNNE